MREEQILTIDGSRGEGGGQILRMSVALAAITGKNVRVLNIRAKRSPPGIRPQHETAIRAIAEVTQAYVDGLNVGSKNLEFRPKKIQCGKFFFNAGTAASTSLIIQALMPVMAFSCGDTWVEIQGGTNNPLAPTFDYLKEVLLPTISKTGLNSNVELVRRGFYPRGGGIVRFWCKPIKKLNPIVLEYGQVKRVYGLSYSSRLLPHIVERMAKSARKYLMKIGLKNIEIKMECLMKNDEEVALDPGCGILLMAELSTGSILAGDSLGEIGKPAERVGQEAVDSLLKSLKSGASVDNHLGDQLIIYMSLSKGQSMIKVDKLTSHLLSCIYVSEKIVGAAFKVRTSNDGATTIICDGVGLENSF